MSNRGVRHSTAHVSLQALAHFTGSCKRTPQAYPVMSAIDKFYSPNRVLALHSRPQGKFLMMVPLEMWIWTANQLIALDFRGVTSSIFEVSSSRLFDDRRVPYLVSSF